ncbi:hypothetical protein X797_007988 [Metarhizium robertsii]|uniref:Uncharacterized protein n=1 Tax=Metarhizium robertsii TaxID=568076 RepID=A0A0A1UST3_9HYPO|nr:hypothetical protein X797_007988 [Metarhizium robertsii]
MTLEGVTNSALTIPGQATPMVAVAMCVQTAVPDAKGHIAPGECGAIWGYYPIFWAALAVACLFGFLVAVHVLQAAVFKKTWCWVIIMATTWEMTAMMFRTLSSRSQQSRGLRLGFLILVLLAPICKGQCIRVYGHRENGMRLPPVSFDPRHALLQYRRRLRLRHGLVAVQLVGGSMATSMAAPHELVIVAFVAPCMIFQVMLLKLEGRPLLLVLYFSLAMITVRNTYRLAEFSGRIRNNSARTTQEAYFYTLEAGPIILGSFGLVLNIGCLYISLLAEWQSRHRQPVADSAPYRGLCLIATQLVPQSCNIVRDGWSVYVNFHFFS